MAGVVLVFENFFGFFSFFFFFLFLGHAFELQF